jgi:hypothetical protein
MKLLSVEVVPRGAQTVMRVMHSGRQALFYRGWETEAIEWLIKYELCRRVNTPRVHQWHHTIAGQWVLDNVELTEAGIERYEHDNKKGTP